MKKNLVVYIISFVVLLIIFGGIRTGEGCFNTQYCSSPGYEVEFIGIRFYYVEPSIDSSNLLSYQSIEPFFQENYTYRFPLTYLTKSRLSSENTTKYDFQSASIDLLLAALIAYLIILITKRVQPKKNIV